jgi:hypothetical protein
LLGALDFLAIAEISSELSGSQVFEKVSNEIDYASYGTNQGFLNDSGALNPLSCRESNDVMHTPGTAVGSGFHGAHFPITGLRKCAEITLGRANRVPESTIRERNRKWKDLLGAEWMYNRSRWKARMKIPVQMLTDRAGSFQT